MRYIDVIWHHDSAEDPIRLVSEIDAEGYEVRKLEFFRQGQVGFACFPTDKPRRPENEISQGQTRLGDQPVPELAAINSSNEFTGKDITKPEFERLWIDHGPKFDEVSAIALLLERGYGFEQYAMLSAYRSDSWNLSVSEHHGFIVRWGEDTNKRSCDEKSFVTAKEAAEFYVQKRKEMQI